MHKGSNDCLNLQWPTAFAIISARQRLWSFEQKDVGSCKSEIADCTNEPNSLKSDVTPFHFVVICWSWGNLSLTNFPSFKRVPHSRKNSGLWKSRYDQNQRGCLWYEAVLLVGTAGRQAVEMPSPILSLVLLYFKIECVKITEISEYQWWMLLILLGVRENNDSCVYPPATFPARQRH